jgi:hypothetical protein
MRPEASLAEDGRLRRSRLLVRSDKRSRRQNRPFQWQTRGAGVVLDEEKTSSAEAFVLSVVLEGELLGWAEADARAAEQAGEVRERLPSKDRAEDRSSGCAQAGCSTESPHKVLRHRLGYGRGSAAGMEALVCFSTLKKRRRLCDCSMRLGWLQGARAEAWRRWGQGDVIGQRRGGRETVVPRD